MKKFIAVILSLIAVFSFSFVTAGAVETGTKGEFMLPGFPMSVLLPVLMLILCIILLI